MSAYMVSDDHINALVTWAVTRPDYQRPHIWIGEPGTIGRTMQVKDNGQELAQTLYSANAKSVSGRYGTDEDSDLSRRFVFKHYGPALKMDPITIIKLCHCYAYQACEPDDWEKSVAYKIVKAIEDAAVRALPGYDAAPRGI